MLIQITGTGMVPMSESITITVTQLLAPHRLTDLVDHNLTQKDLQRLHKGIVAEPSRMIVGMFEYRDGLLPNGKRYNKWRKRMASAVNDGTLVSDCCIENLECYLAIVIDALDNRRSSAGEDTLIAAIEFMPANGATLYAIVELILVYPLADMLQCNEPPNDSATIVLVLCKKELYDEVIEWLPVNTTPL